MRFYGGDNKETYLYISGLVAHKAIKLSDNLELQPAKCTSYYEVSQNIKNDADLGVAMLFLHRIGSQLKITTQDNDIGIRAWNSQWDIIILGAILDIEIGVNFQSDVEAQYLTVKDALNITGYNFRGFVSEPYQLKDEDCKWIEENYGKIKILMNTSEEFSYAINALANYRCNPYIRAKFSLIWSAIEGLFLIENEISFRLSLYISNFLFDDDVEAKKEIFAKTKKLYGQRSKVVHGSKMHSNIHDYFNESLILLRKIVFKCIEIGSIPDVTTLIFK